MHTEKREDPLVELGYEVRDLNTVAIRNATIGFFIFAIGSAIIGFACYRVMNPTVFEPTPASRRVVAAAPNPLLQTTTGSKTDIMDIRQHETALLTGPPTWVDANKTHLRIPLERAMQIIVSKGLPSTGAAVPAVSKGHTPDPAIGEKTQIIDAPAVIVNGPGQTINIDMSKDGTKITQTTKPAPKKGN